MARELDKVLDLRKQLQTASSANDDAQVRTILLRLRQEVKPTEELIRESKIGLAVGKLRTNANKEVAELAKDIVRKWKQDVGPARATPPVKGETKPSPGPVASTSIGKGASPAENSKSASPVASIQRQTSTSSNNGASTSGSRSAKSDGMTFDVFLDKTRDKCMELIYDALCHDQAAPPDQIYKQAQAIEEGAYAGCDHSVSAAYKAKMRSLFLNLKEKNNPELRRGIIEGEIEASKVWSMTPTELASEERKAHDKAITDANLFEALGAGAQSASTDLFVCGRCKQRKCTYYQLQTRSADEPMTTFVTCTNCDNRWKF